MPFHAAVPVANGSGRSGKPLCPTLPDFPSTSPSACSIQSKSEEEAAGLQVRCWLESTSLDAGHPEVQHDPIP